MRLTLQHGFDRIKIWFDHAEYPGSLDDLRPHCGDVKLTCGQMLYNARWKSALELYQPTLKCLQVLRDVLQDSTVEYQFGEAEIALDLIPLNSRRKLAQHLGRAFIAAAVPKHHRREALCIKGTWYFERRTKPDQRPRTHVLVVYFDCPSKLNNQQIDTNTSCCLHIEWRVTGVVAMEKLGLYRIDDLIAFPHKKFWSKHVHLYALPRKTDLGRFLAGTVNANVSGTALRKRADRWQQQFTTSSDKSRGQGQFVLYNALRGTKQRSWERQRTTFKQWLQNALNCSHGGFTTPN